MVGKGIQQGKAICHCGSYGNNTLVIYHYAGQPDFCALQSTTLLYGLGVEESRKKCEWLSSPLPSPIFTYCGGQVCRLTPMLCQIETRIYPIYQSVCEREIVAWRIIR